MKEHITLAELKELRACCAAQIAFKQIFGEETTIAKLLKEVRRFNRGSWEGWLLCVTVEITEAMIHHGANINVTSDLALRRASAHGRTEVVKLLIHHGADFNAKGSSALEWALENGHAETAKVIRVAMAA